MTSDDDRPIVRPATDAEQRAAIVAEARRLVREEGAAHECNEWIQDGACALCDRVVAPLVVGDLVTVARACLGNPEASTAVVVETYDRDPRGGDRSGAVLLFQNGAHDGFSPSDVVLFGVVRVGRLRFLESYRFQSIGTLERDFRAGLFVAAWRDPAVDECVCRTRSCGHPASAHFGGACRICRRGICWA